jgi:hypothetical protein
MFALPVLLILLPLADEPPVPPLTQEQKAKIQTLVRQTRAEMTLLRGKLDEKQRELGRRYAEFDLDLPAVEKLQAEILGLQKSLLGTYHGLHVGLRKIVGRERFAVLRRRIDNLLNAPPKKDK